MESEASGRSRGRTKPIAPIKFVLPVSIACALAVAYTSKDFCCFPAGAAIFSILVLALLERLWSIERLYHWRHIRTAQWVALPLLVAAFAVAFRTDRGELFREAFASDVPSGVRNLVVDRYVHGLSGDKWALIRFDADRATMEQLWTQGEFGKDENFELYLAQGESWKGLFSAAFSNFCESGGAAWREVAPMADPVYRRRTWKDRTASPSTSLLWDPSTGRAYALYAWD